MALPLMVMPAKALAGRIPIKASSSPFYEGELFAEPDILCGKCGVVLARFLTRQQLGGVILKCSHCGALNDSALGFQ